jgi:proteic killer suppression protein
MDRYTILWYTQYRKRKLVEIISYGNKETENFDLKGKLNKRCKWANIEKIARRKLDILIYGHSIEDFKIPPNNKFEWLKGNLKGFASIRINDQWRIIFNVNKKNQLENVEIIDYHRG